MTVCDSWVMVGPVPWPPIMPILMGLMVLKSSLLGCAFSASTRSSCPFTVANHGHRPGLARAMKEVEWFGGV